MIASAPKPAPAPVRRHTAAEQARALALLEAGKGQDALTKQAIREGWPVEKLRAKVDEEESVGMMLAHVRRR